MQKKPLMFDFITHTRNPLGGECFGCTYCYIHGKKGWRNRFTHLKAKYSGEFRLEDKYLEEKFVKGNYVFFCDCIDYLHPDCPDNIIRAIYEWIKRNPDAKFLSLTKNPNRYLWFEYELPTNMVLGTTIESNYHYPKLSESPKQRDRIRAMKRIIRSTLRNWEIMICIEPILDFKIMDFVYDLHMIRPNFVVVGYDNHNNRLNEPPLEKTLALIRELESVGIKVIRKTIRKAWWEEQ